MTLRVFIRAALVLTLAGTALAANPGLEASDASHSLNASRLIDGMVGPGLELSWGHAGNRWDEAQFPMTAVLELDEPSELESLSYFVGEIGDLGQAAFSVFVRPVGSGEWQFAGVAFANEYDTWQRLAFQFAGEVDAVMLSFESVESVFNVAEVELNAPLVQSRDRREPDAGPSSDPSVLPD